MQHPNGGYYLHENGKLIYKPHGLSDEDIMDSDLVVNYWPNAQIGGSPADFLTFLREAKGWGADESEIVRLAEHNKLDEFVPGWQEQL
jgi:hypothetical protein